MSRTTDLYDYPRVNVVTLPIDASNPVPVTFNASDLQIGAVEIKNGTDDTRAVVGANGLYADIRMVLTVNRIVVNNAISRIDLNARSILSCNYVG